MLTDLVWWNGGRGDYRHSHAVHPQSLLYLVSVLVVDTAADFVGLYRSSSPLLPLLLHS
jgi:hypothetical protein